MMGQYNPKNKSEMEYDDLADKKAKVKADDKKEKPKKK